MQKRTLISEIRYLLSNFPVVAVLGARQVGKSTLLKQLLPKAAFFDLENEADFLRIEQDAALVLQETKRPVIFDEAQFSRALFKALRVEVDKQRQQNGQFLISGSSSPALLTSISETLAGRVAIVELQPFTWQEGLNKKAFNLSQCLSNPEKLLSLTANFTKIQLLDLCLHGGYPEPFLKRKDDKFFNLWMENYVKTYIDRDIRVLFANLDMVAYRRFIQMLAFANGDMINAAKFANSLGVSQPTVRNYLSIVEGTFLWRKLPAYQSNHNKSLVKTPKGHLRDSGLINYFLRLTNANDMKAHPQFGNIWESFVIEQIIRHFSNRLIAVDFYYYRSRNGAEIDLIIQYQNQTIPIEIKSASVVRKQQLMALKRFIDEYNCPFGLVVNNGDEVFKLADNIYQLPAVCL